MEEKFDEYSPEERLKPCPFCGGRASVNYDINLEPNAIYCRTCKAFVRWSNIGDIENGETYGEYAWKFIERWNRRPNMYMLDKTPTPDDPPRTKLPYTTL